MRFINYLIVITAAFYSDNFSFLFIPVHIGWLRFTIKPFILVLIWLLLKLKIRRENLPVFILFSCYCLTTSLFSTHKNFTEYNILFNSLILLVMPDIDLKEITRASNIAILIISIYTVVVRYWNPNSSYPYSFSTPLIMFFPFILCGVLKGDKLSMFGLALSILSIFLTLAKSCWAVLILVIPLFFITKSDLKPFIKSVLSIFALLFVFFPQLAQTITRFDKSLFVRIDIWEQLLKHVSFIGRGLDYHVFANTMTLGSHNTFLEALISGGLIGFIFYMSAIVLIFKRLLGNKSLLSRACLVSMIAWCIHGMFQVVINEYAFWVVAGISLTLNDKVG